MSGYKTFGASSKTTTKEKKSPTPTPTQSINRRSSRNKKRNNGIPYYSSPVVSAPLVTAFGLPTLIECEPPTLPSIEIETPSSSPKIFTSLKERSKSLPLSPSSPATTNIRQQQQQRARSKSYISEDSTESLAPQDNTITAYTYRVTAIKSDDHKLYLSQNLDGTYSHEDTTNTTNMNSNKETAFGNDDVPESDTGLLMSSQNNGQPSMMVSLDTVTKMEETLEKMDEGTLPPNVHPVVPPEMLDPRYTKTVPSLKLWPLAVLVFYNVSGGPFGIEPSIRAGGNFFAIMGFIIFPFVWSVPEALVTAELGSAFQDPAAGVAWVEEAFGESAAGLCGYLAWVSGATDNAIYPTLFIEYVTSVIGWDEDDFGGWVRFGSIAAITVCLAMLNYTGLEIVGNASLVICVIAMSPFLLLTIVGANKVVPSRWLQMPEQPEDGVELFDDDFQTSAGPLPLLALGGVLWRPYLNNMFWNLNSFDSAASFAGETSSASTTYPRGIFIGLIMCVLSYIVPILVAVGATDYTQSEWVDGHLGAVAVEVGGKWLGMWTIFAAGISNLALFEAEMSSDAFQLMGMAERGFLPKIFATRSKHGTPTAGIVFNTLVIIAFSCADFGQLLELLNSVYAISLLMEYAAFVKLRLYRPELQRPYRIPVPDWAAPIVVLPPIAGILLIFALSNWYVYIFCAGSLVFGWLIAKLSDVCKRKGWVEYYETKSSEAKGPSYEYDLAPLGSPSSESNGESESNGRDTPTMDVRCDTPTHSEPDSENSDWDYRNEEQIKIEEENRIT